MFFVFGWGFQTVKNHGPVKIYHCEHCNNDKYWTLHSRRTWFTLFFIPIIPYSTEHVMICPICNHGARLDREKFIELKAISQCNMDLINKKITDDQHAEILKSLAAQDNRNYTDENASLPKTETQLNYIKQMNEFKEKENSTSV